MYYKCMLLILFTSAVMFADCTAMVGHVHIKAILMTKCLSTYSPSPLKQILRGQMFIHVQYNM
jgi:hypothetical protein